MKSGVSIANPTAEDLANCEISREIGSDEKVLWLGSPDMRYAFTLASPTSLLIMLVIVSYWIIKMMVGFDGSGYMVRALVVFSLTFAFALALDLMLVASLRYVSYLISDKTIYFFLRDFWFMGVAPINQFRKGGEPCFDGRGRVIKYELPDVARLEAYRSLVNKSVGNISIDTITNVMASRTYTDTNSVDTTIKCRYRKMLFTTRLFLSETVYAVNGVSSVCGLLECAIKEASDRSK